MRTVNTGYGGRGPPSTHCEIAPVANTKAYTDDGAARHFPRSVTLPARRPLGRQHHTTHFQNVPKRILSWCFSFDTRGPHERVMEPAFLCAVGCFTQKPKAEPSSVTCNADPVAYPSICMISKYFFGNIVGFSKHTYFSQTTDCGVVQHGDDPERLHVGFHSIETTLTTAVTSPTCNKGQNLSQPVFFVPPTPALYICGNRPTPEPSNCTSQRCLPR